MAEGISKEEEKREGEKDVLHIDVKFATNGQMTSNFTAQNIQFSIKDFSVNVIKSAGNCGCSHIY